MLNKDTIRRWHDAYQRALSQSPTGGDGIVRIFEKLVGTPPMPADKAAYDVYISLLEDLRRMEGFERRYPLAMVAFGSARLSSDDRYYILATEVGEKLARRGFLVRTGAGPGIMDAVPMGWKREVSRSSSSMSMEHTQGIRIELPFEQAVSPSIDTNTMMRTFSIRRTALIWNSRGIAVFPGGMGTINELFEAWVGASDHKVACPIVVIPYSFYRPLFNAIRSVAVLKKRTITSSDFNLVQRSADNVDEAVQMLTQPMREKDSGTQFTLREKLIYLRHELGRGITAASNLPSAAIIMGSRQSLCKVDREIQFIIRLTKVLMAETSHCLRLGVDGLINDAVTECVDECVPSQARKSNNRIQRILMMEAMGFVYADAYFESRCAHCESLLCNAKAAFFLPADIPTLNVLFALVCEIQTGRREKMPLFLVGCDYWQPIFNGLRETLRGEYDGQYIKYTDLNIMTVIGTTQQDLRSVMEIMGPKI